jgi:hypothetical protein
MFPYCEFCRNIVELSPRGGTPPSSGCTFHPLSLLRIILSAISPLLSVIVVITG